MSWTSFLFPLICFLSFLLPTLPPFFFFLHVSFFHFPSPSTTVRPLLQFSVLPLLPFPSVFFNSLTTYSFHPSSYTYQFLFFIFSIFFFFFLILSARPFPFTALLFPSSSLGSQFLLFPPLSPFSLVFFLSFPSYLHFPVLFRPPIPFTSSACHKA